MKNTKLEICHKCWGTGCVHGGDESSTWSETCEDCHGVGFVRVPKTNADRIRAMSDEELADLIDGIAMKGWLQYVMTSALEWLQQPAEGGA